MAWRLALVALLPAAGAAAQSLPPDPAAQVARAFGEQVTPTLTPPADEQARYGELAAQALRAAGITPLGPQFVIVVVRDIRVQAALLYWLAQPPLFLGAAPVSTGRVGQFDHFETPTGVFSHTLANPDFRAEGTRNANGILGYGAKGMRVYDFGWQTANKGWGDRAPATMRLQMHATDPYVLEQRLGTAQSKGCIRIPATFNRLIAHDMNHCQRLLLTLGRMTTDERIASFLVETSEQMAAHGYSSRQFVLKMTREDIANHLGMKIETVCRVFARLQAASLLLVSKRHLEILDVDALRRLSCG